MKRKQLSVPESLLWFYRQIYQCKNNDNKKNPNNIQCIYDHSFIVFSVEYKHTYLSLLETWSMSRVFMTDWITLYAFISFNANAEVSVCLWKGIYL